MHAGVCDGVVRTAKEIISVALSTWRRGCSASLWSVKMFGSDGVVRATAGRFEGDCAAVRTSAVSVRRCPCTACAGVRMPSTQRDGRRRSGYKPESAAPLFVVDLWLRRRPLWDALRGSDYTSSSATRAHGKGVLAEAPSCSCCFWSSARSASSVSMTC